MTKPATQQAAQRVLIVEDDAWLGESMTRLVTRAGFEARHSPHAVDAIQQIDEFQPDAIMLDVLLTATTAFPLLHELQSHDDTARLPVVLCTNLADSLRLDDVSMYGVRRIVDKTRMTPDDIIAALRSVL